jgi:hypothetical protein
LFGNGGRSGANSTTFLARFLTVESEDQAAIALDDDQDDAPAL